MRHWRRPSRNPADKISLPRVRHAEKRYLAPLMAFRMALDQYGHLFGDRLDVVADAMDMARTAALLASGGADGYPMGTGGQVVNLRL